MKTLVVIPTYDERDNVGPMAQAVLAQSPELELLFVDDNSPDGTGAILDGLAAENPRIHVLHRPGKEGLGRAYTAGFSWALERDYSAVIQMDCDFSHDPADIPRFLEALGENDLVIGSRYAGGIRVLDWPFSRLIISLAAGVYVRLVTGMPVSDPTGGFKAFRAEVLREVDLSTITSNGYSFQLEVNHAIWMSGRRLVEMPIIFRDRAAGYSKMNLDIAFESMLMVLKVWARNRFRRRPRRRASV